jgi:hypothetical protein
MRRIWWFVLAAVIPCGTATAVPAPGACTYRGTADSLKGRLSPLDSTVLSVDGATIKVCYGRPFIRGRVIMGGLVPFGEPWRLGANEPTRLVLPFAATVAGVRVEPGTYSLYVVPQKTSWEIHVNTDVDRWGIPIDSLVRARDVGTGTVPVETLPQVVDQLTLRLVARTPVELVVTWEKTRVRIPIERR